MIYVGVGSRKTPRDVLQLMRRISEQGMADEHVLRTGDAAGADLAFRESTMRKVVFGAHKFWFGTREMTYEGASWDKADAILHQIMDAKHYQNVKFKDYVHRLHMRNTFQVLGVNHTSPAKLLICWTPGGEMVGGTRTAILCAMLNEIPVYNLGDQHVYDTALEAVDQRVFPFLEKSDA